MDLEAPTPVDQVHLGCTPRATAIDEESIKAKTDLFQMMTTSNVDETPKSKVSHTNSTSFGLELRYERARRTMR